MSESLRPPTKGGSGPLIGVIVLMLLGMGGLIYWKLSGSDPPPEPPKPVATQEPQQVFDEPPPPPPKPVEEPDAGPDEKKVVKAKGPFKAGPGRCGGECKGTATAALRSALRGKAGQARGCYERALRQNNLLQGKLTVSVRIGPGGEVCSVGVASDTIGGGVATCVLPMFKSGTFPAPQGGCVDTAVPMNFVPKT